MHKDHPVFEIVTTTTGAISIRNKVVNEIMHNPVGPWAEANALYVEQSGLKELLTEDTDEELVLFDVGLGAASNAVAALSCLKKIKKPCRPLRIVSFERDLELLRFTLEHASSFEHLQGYEKTLQQLLDTKIWTTEGITWELREGDFLEVIDHEPHRAHLVFFDPYSPNVNEDMWTVRCFKKLRAKCREPGEGAAKLYTYSLATRIRASLIIAGFYVGHGTATGEKKETTEASTDLKDLSAPLGQPWLNRWRRSHLRLPFDCKPEQEVHYDEIVDSYMKSLGCL